MVFIIIIGGILVLFIYITRLASKEIFSPSNNIHREVRRAKDLSAHLYPGRFNFILQKHAILWVALKNTLYFMITNRSLLLHATSLI